MTGSLSCSSHDHMSPVRIKGSRSMHSLSQPPPWFSSACRQSGKQPTTLSRYTIQLMFLNHTLLQCHQEILTFNKYLAVHTLKGDKDERSFITQAFTKINLVHRKNVLIALFCLIGENMPFSLQLVNRNCPLFCIVIVRAFIRRLDKQDFTVKIQMIKLLRDYKIPCHISHGCDLHTRKKSGIRKKKPSDVGCSPARPRLCSCAPPPRRGKGPLPVPEPPGASCPPATARTAE